MNKFRIILQKDGITALEGEDILAPLLAEASTIIGGDTDQTLVSALKFTPTVPCTITYKTNQFNVNIAQNVPTAWATDDFEMQYSNFYVGQSGVTYTVTVGVK